MTHFDYLIIGAGITGVTFARLLQNAGVENFCILEKNSEPGGLCRSRSVNGHELDIGGGHFLCTQYPEVYDLIFSHIPIEEFNSFKRVSKINLEGHIIDYPVESNIWQLPKELQQKYLDSVMLAGSTKGNQEPTTYLEWISWRLGDRISSQYMLPYNRKIWGVEPSEMDVDWLHKIPKLSVEEIRRAIDSKLSSTDKFPSHSTFYYPKVGGFQTVFDAIAKHVTKNVILNTKIERIEQISSGWRINDRYESKVVINTAPWPSLLPALNPPQPLNYAFKNLRSNSVVVSLIEQDYNHDYHWLYEPDIDVNHHREFFIHNFAPHSKRSGVYLETNEKRWKQGEKVGKFGKIPIYEHVNEVAYPIPTLGHAGSIETIRSYYGERGFHGLGRWGQWKYFNSDVCIWEAIKFAKTLL